MARFSYEGYDEIIRQTERAGGELHKRIERALKLSAELLVEALKAEEKNSFKAPSGEMGEILTRSPEITISSDYSMAEVYPRGDYVGIRGRPRRAATIAFVLENGKPGHLEANPWNARASKNARKRINSIVNESLRGDTT